MKKRKVSCPACLLAMGLVLTFGGCNSKTGPADLTQWDAELTEKYINVMTVEEKIGQTIQVSLMTMGMNDAAMERVKTYYIGSVFTNADNRPYTPEQWVNLINNFQRAATATRMKIPLIYGVDAVHGHNSMGSATIFPHNSGLGAIAVADLEQGLEAGKTAGRITAKEMRASGYIWTFSPQVSPAHDVRWGRAFESFAEKAEITAAMGKAVIAGYQTNGVAATAKHYAGEGWNLYGINGGLGGNAGTADQPLTAEMLEDAVIPYRAAVEAGVYTVMSALSNTNGVHNHRNPLLQKMLKDKLGFKGFVVGDWNGSGTGTTLRDSFNAGVDMHMMGDQAAGQYANNFNSLVSYVNDGTITMKRLNDAVLRILRVKKALGLLEKDYDPVLKAGEIGTAANRADARRIAAKTLTLMKNENQAVQKLQTAAKILITGQAANNVGMQCGGWTYNWQRSTNVPTVGTTVYNGRKNAIGESRVTLSNAGTNATAGDAITGTYDAIIAVIGEGPHAENAGDRGTDNSANIPLRVGGGQENSAEGDWNDVGMLNAVYAYKAANPDVPLIVLMLAGRPMTITDNAAAGNPHHTYWDAFIVGWLPGSETGDAVADVLFGDKDFTGKTPFTWRTSYATVPGPLNAGTYPESSQVIYPYGHGLTKAGN